MPAITTVTLVDDDGDEFPIALPGIYKDERSKKLDIDAAIHIAEESVQSGTYRPNGKLKFDRIEYTDEVIA